MQGHCVKKFFPKFGIWGWIVRLGKRGFFVTKLRDTRSQRHIIPFFSRDGEIRDASSGVRSPFLTARPNLTTKEILRYSYDFLKNL
jgi:hypothetical protein